MPRDPLQTIEQRTREQPMTGSIRVGVEHVDVKGLGSMPPVSVE